MWSVPAGFPSALSLRSSQLRSTHLVLRNYTKDIACIVVFAVFSPLYRNQLCESETPAPPRKKKSFKYHISTDSLGNVLLRKIRLLPLLVGV